MDQLSRRRFLGTVTALAASALAAAPQPESDLILDLHQHTNYNGRSDEQLINHQAYHNVTSTVLLPGDGWMLSIVGDNASCAALATQYPNRFARFACSDPAQTQAADALRDNVRRGALGIGEMKFRVAVDSAEMHRVYQAADELRVPVLIHFEHLNYNTGIERLPSILKAYPKVNFIGHAQTWWGNISADLDPRVMYPQGPVKRGGLIDRWLSDYPNLYGDLSAGSGLNALTRDAQFARDFVHRHGRKLIWGSDCDCRDGQGGGTDRGYCIAGRCLALLRVLASDPAAFRRIVWDNGAALLRLRAPASSDSKVAHPQG
ncbi:MAG TPA: amidohydrolase family protein [Terriglobia bacterium]|nr:amidohydrolase family protein [Terriglobia bacterium]